MSRRTRFTPDEKLAMVLAGLRGRRRSPSSVGVTASSPRSTTTGGTSSSRAVGARLESAKASTQGRALEARVRELERALGKKTLELEIAGKALGMLR